MLKNDLILGQCIQQLYSPVIDVLFSLFIFIFPVLQNSCWALAGPGWEKQKSRKRQNYIAEVASSVWHSRNLQKNTNDRNAEES